MGLDFDVLEFCRKLRTSKQPPYECPVPQCGKVYKSLCGLQYHLVNYDHNNPTPTNPTPVSGRKKGRGSAPGRQSTTLSAAATPTTVTRELLAMPTREGLTYAEAQKMVEFEVDGRITRVNIYDQLPVISKEKYEAAYGSLDNVATGPPAALEEKVNLPEPCYTILDTYNISDAPPRPNAYIRFIERSAEELDGEVEYDMDEEDAAWLSIINERRAAAGLCEVPVDTFELLMDRLEKESYFQMQSNGKTGDGSTPTVIDDDAVCCICMDGECQNSNVILFCDMCNLAVHQDCYGVPYIPEGQWLCRRCLQSPSRAVDCVLCPNNGGAFKQTDRGHWAHVVCALWIPEVRFANTVFLEPIDSIETIPPARWKLTCYICKQRGVGACIQCHKTNCYAAFHVTCAQQAGLYMKMDTVRDSTTGTGLDPGPVLVQKTAFCDTHTPADADSRPRIQSSSQSPGSDENSSPGSGRDKMKKARRLLAKKRSSLPVISIPTIPPERIQEIASLVSLPKKSQLIQRLIAYWTLKRQFRNGVPLLRRLQSSHLARRDDSRPLQEVVSDAGELYRQLKFWQCLRQDLERARLLCELVRKREKLKKEFTKVKELCLRLELWPREWMMLRLLDLIQARDAGDIFSEPVDPSEVPDYAEVVKNPMDISTMRLKAQSFQYQNLDALEADFNLMISNCMAYNSRDTIFYRAAIKMRDQGGALIRQARRDMEATGFDPVTGLLLPEGQSGQPPEVNQGSSPNVTNVSQGISSEEGLAAEIDRQVAEVMDRLDHMASREALARLLELLDRSQRLKHGLARAKRTRFIKAEIAKLRRRMALGAGLGASAAAARFSDGAAPPTASEGEDGFESDTEREDTTDEEAAVAGKAKRAGATATPAVASGAPPAAEKPARPLARRTTASSTASSSAASTAASSSTAATREPSHDSSKESSEEGAAAGSSSRGAATDATPAAKSTPAATSVPTPAPTPTPGKRGRRKKPGKRPREDSTDARPASAAASSAAPAGSASAPAASPQQATPALAAAGASPQAPASKVPALQGPGGPTAAGAGTPATPTAAATTSPATPAAGGSPAISQTPTSASSQPKALSSSAPTTPAKLGVTSEHQAQMTVSPSGVNRRTAVLFTRKAQAAAAFRKPELPGANTPMTPAIAPPPTNKRRVGRPRKNLDAALSSRPSEPPSLLAGGDLSGGTTGAVSGSMGVLEKGGVADLNLSSSPLPFSESFRVYRQGGEIPAETDEDTQSDSSCSSCSSTDGSTGSTGGVSSSLDLQHPSAGDSSADDEAPTATPQVASSSSGVTASSAQGPAGVGTPASLATSTGDASALEPLDMVWAKCRGYPWYPALIIDPKMPRSGYLHNGVPIPAPPIEVLNLASNYDEPVYLVLFFDTKRTWQWLPRNKLERLGISTEVDQSKLIESRKPTERKAVRKAYQEAMTHRCQVAGGNRRGRGSIAGPTAAAAGDDI